MTLSYSGPGRPRATCGFTLFEVSISLLILTAVVTIIFLLISSGLKAQQRNRLQMLASVKMMELSEAWANPPLLNVDVSMESAEMAESGTKIEHDLETRLFHKWKDLDGYGMRQILGWNGVSIVPPEIAARLESDNHEIAEILASGGQLYFFKPNADLESEGQTGLNEIVAGEDKSVNHEERQLVFAVRGAPQQNSLPGHPILGWPYYEHYPFPLQPWHMRLWHWNVHRTAPAKAVPGNGIYGVQSVAIEDAGSGYSDAPVITVPPPGAGRQARLRAIVNRGVLCGVHILDPGFGYAGSDLVLTLDAGNGRRNGNGGTAPITDARIRISFGEVVTGMVDYSGVANDAWPARHPSLGSNAFVPDWPAADDAFRQLYEYQYHFIRATSPADRTWIAQMGRIQNKALPLPWNSGWPRPTDDGWRDTVNRMTITNIWDSTVPPETTTAMLSYNYDNADDAAGTVTTAATAAAATGESIVTGERARLREYLVRSHRLVRTLLVPGAVSDRISYQEWPVGNDSQESWPLPNPPNAFPALPAAAAAGAGWPAGDEHVRPPPYKILALSYLLYATHLATTRVPPGGTTALFSGSSGWITAINVTAGGGYTRQPYVKISGGGGEGARAQAVLDATGAVARVVVLDPGQGYTSVPTISFDPPGAVATATIDAGPRWTVARSDAECTRLRAYYTQLQGICEAWFLRYASSDPYNLGAPRPTNRALAWDHPLLQHDLFPSGAMRPSAAEVAALPNSVRDFAQNLPNAGSNPALATPATFRWHYGDLDLFQSTLGGAYSLFSRASAGGADPSLQQRLAIERERPAWRSGAHNAKDIYRYTDGTPTADNIDRSWRVIGGRQPTDWGPANGMRFWHAEGRMHKHQLPPGSPGDYDNAANLWYSWGNTARFNLTDPFHAAERCREVVFWAVDWMDYEDFETAADPPIDSRSLANTSAAYGAKSSRGAEASDNAASVYNVSSLRGFTTFAVQQPVDRNGNGRPSGASDRSYDTGNVKPTVRMRASSIARFVYYDGRLIGGLRQ